jgi:hypothetical protein
VLGYAADMAASTPKARAIEALNALPEDVALEDAIERLCSSRRSKKACASPRPAS